MARSYDYNMRINVLVNDKALNQLEKRIDRLRNKPLKINPKYDSGSSRQYWRQQSSYLRNFGREQSTLAKNMTNFSRDYSRTASELNRSVASMRSVNSLGRRMGVAREKGSRLMDMGGGMATYLGLSGLKKYIYDTPVQAETNKWLMSTMGDKTASSQELYQKLDVTTDKLPISMQSVAQPLYAFKAASGAEAETIKDIIPQFANFGAVVQNMTGSTELAETAMMKLGYGLKGRFAALDQYGITEDALKRTGKWSGDQKDVKGYMAAVSQIVGNAEDSMTTFAGKVKQVEKSLSRAGKQLWENGLGDALKGVVGLLNGFLNAGKGIFAKASLIGTAAITGILGITAASGYLLQAIGSIGESFVILRGAIGDFVNSLAVGLSRGRAVGRVSALEGTLARQQNPVYVGGLHDYSRRNIENSGFSDRQKNKIYKSKRRDREYVKRFGWGDETNRQITAVKSDKTMSARERRKAIKQIKRSRLNELNNMGGFGRIREAGFGKSLRSMGGAFKKGWGEGSGLGKLTGGLSQLGGVFGTLVGVVNPLNVALVALVGVFGLLAGVFATAYISSDAFRQHVARVGQKLMDLANTFMGFVGDIFQATGLSGTGGIDGVIEVAEKILTAIEHGIDWLKGVMEGLTGHDYTAESGYSEATKTKDDTERQIKELQKQGKQVPKDLSDRLKWSYDRMAYFSAPNKESADPMQGGYWKDKGGKYDTLELQNPGLKIDPYSNPKDVLNQIKEYNLGDLGIDGVGQPRDYNPQVYAKQQQQQQTKNFLPDILSAIGNPGGFALGKAFEQITKSFTGNKEKTNNQPLEAPKTEDSNKVFEDLINGARGAANWFENIFGEKQPGSGVKNPAQNVNNNGNGTTGTPATGGGTAGTPMALTKSLDGNAIVDTFRNQVVPGVTGVMGDIGNVFQNNVPMLSMAGQMLGLGGANGLKIGMSGMGTNANSEAAKVPGAINGQSGNVSSTSSAMGRGGANSFKTNFNLHSWAAKEVDWLVQAIKGKAGEVAQAAAELAKAAYNAITNQNQNASPGLIARWGGQEVKWMAEAIRGKTPLVINEMKSLASSLLPQMTQPRFDYDITRSTQRALSQNPVDIYNTATNTRDIPGTPSIGQSDRQPPNQDNSQVINLTFNIEKVDSKDRVNEIKDVIYETLFFNNETAGRNEPAPLV